MAKNISKKGNKKENNVRITLSEEVSIRHAEELKKTLSEACLKYNEIQIQGKLVNIDLVSLQLLQSFSVQCKEDKKKVTIDIELEEPALSLIKNCNIQHILNLH